MKILLMRHGEASFEAKRDFDRKLTPKGREVVDLRGVQLKAQGIHVKKLIVSPYIRTLETAELIQARLGGVECVESNRITPDVIVGEALAELRDQMMGGKLDSSSEDAGVMMVVTHQPLIGILIEHLTGHARPMQPGDMVMIETPAITAGFGEIVCEF